MDDIIRHYLALKAQLQELYESFDHKTARGVLLQVINEHFDELERQEGMRRARELAEQAIEEITRQNNTY